MKMANVKKSIIEEALLEAQAIDATFKSNAKEILAHTMSSEIEEMVKESLTGSKKKKGLKEDEEDEVKTDLDLDLDSEDGDDDLDLNLDAEVGAEGDDLDLDLGTEDDDEEGEEIEGDELGLDTDGDEGLDLGGEDDLDLGGLDLGGNNADLDDLGGGDIDLDNLGGEGDMETVDLTGASDSDVISVFKKMGPEDEIEVVNDNGMVTLKDNKSGSEYRIELNPTGGVSNAEVGELELGGLEEGVIYEIIVEEDDEEDDMSDYMSDYMEDEDEDNMSYMNEPGVRGSLPTSDDTQETDYMNEPGVRGSLPTSDDSQATDYMSRVRSSKQRYHVGNRTNPNAIDRMGGKDSYRATYGESRTSETTKLIKENTNLSTKNSTLETENTELKENHDKMVDALKQFRKKLQEVAVFNSNLTYAVRLFTENSTTKEEKQEILKKLDSAKDLKESQSIYKLLVKEYTNGKAPIKETIEEKFNKTATSGAQISEQSVFVHPELQNMKKLWEYDYKK
jgi:hypothetical protein